ALQWQEQSGHMSETDHTPGRGGYARFFLVREKPSNAFIVITCTQHHWDNLLIPDSARTHQFYCKQDHDIELVIVSQTPSDLRTLN
ncbi:hypothetical protein BaRGS_00023796, partial [Batillaria attramentaria]